ncbi:hypothetical protein [Streptomyces sp. AC550_RSS872]|uniref:hypothetical protein n=1 Tax=Streptomyces sp. AC550_RSS872 TaxID=2823689 RepID=UPI001C2581A7|nr:hypothetical protein [Streptomyces sp. AC550_RSS872]
MHAIVRHRHRSIAKPAACRAATIALTVLAVTVPASAAMAAEPAPGQAVAASAGEAAPGRAMSAIATTLVDATRETVSDVVGLLAPLGNTWGG